MEEPPWLPVKTVVVMCRVMMYEKAVSLFKAKTFSHSTLMNIWAMRNQTKPHHLHWCFLDLPRCSLTVIPFKTLCFSFHRFLISFVRVSILLDDFLHKWIKWTIKGSNFWVWLLSSHILWSLSVDKGCRVQNHTTACRKLDSFLSIASPALTIWMWWEAEQGYPRESIYCVFFWTLGTLITTFLGLGCMYSTLWNWLLKHNFKLKNTSDLSCTVTWILKNPGIVGINGASW